MMTFTELAPAASDPSEPFTDRLRLAVAAYLARFKGSSREHTESDLRCHLAWCAERGLDPLAAQRPHLELYIRRMQEIRRFRPSTVSRRFSVVAGFYRTCVIDGLMQHSPAEHVRRPAVPAESPTLGFTHLQFEALLTAARESANPSGFALVAMLGLPGLRIFEATSANITDLGEEHGHRVLRVCGKGSKVVQVPLPPAVSRAIDRAAGPRDHGPILVNNRGTRVDRHAAARRLRRLAGSAGLRTRAHPRMLRHTFVTTMQGRGVASDATFRVWREDGLAGAATLPGACLARGPAAGHAVDQGFLAAGCVRCQDVASEPVALGDRWLHLTSRVGGCMGVVRGPLALVAADGAVPVSPGAALLEEMLAGWRRQQMARRLTLRLIGERERVVRQFAAYTGCWPWQWSAAQAEAWVASGGWAHSTVRSYQGALALFLEYVCDPRYGWVSECEQRAGAVPVQVFHERNIAVHVSEQEGRPERRPLTRAELQAFFDAADGHVDRAAGWRRKGWLAAFRDATLFKVIYGWGLRRREAAMLDVADFAPSPAAPEFGALGVCHVRYGKAMRGSPPRRRAVAAVMPWAVAALAQYLDEVRPRYGAHAHPALWLTERGERISPRSVDERFAAWRQAAGLPRELSVHCLRHSHVSHLIEDGADPLFVQFQAGHSWASTTATYTTVGQDARNRMLRAALARAFEGERGS